MLSSEYIYIFFFFIFFLGVLGFVFCIAVNHIMDSRTLLDHALFQLTPTRTRYALHVALEITSLYLDFCWLIMVFGIVLIND